jgi:hypothetical protein
MIEVLQSVLDRLTPFVLSQRVWNHVKELPRRFDAAVEWKDPADRRASIAGLCQQPLQGGRLVRRAEP